MREALAYLAVLVAALLACSYPPPEKLRAADAYSWGQVGGAPSWETGVGAGGEGVGGAGGGVSLSLGGSGGADAGGDADVADADDAGDALAD